MRIFYFILLFVLGCSYLFAQSPIYVSIDTKSIVSEIPENFIGLSYEMEKVLPDDKGKYFFAPSNKHLIAAFKMLGIRNLRLGGNTADRLTIKVPNKRDIDTLFAFAKAAGVKIIYTLRLRNGNTEKASEIVKYIMDNYKSLIDCFAIGNEPNVFSKEYSVYHYEWMKYFNIIKSRSPDVKFCGPSSTPGKVEWSKNFADDFSGLGAVKFISQHAYPGGSGRKVSSPEVGCKEMLSPLWVESYQKFYDSFVPEVESKGFSYRIEETNSYFHGGAAGVSNTFASALWGLDYLFWWASHQATGLNFHTGDIVAAGETNSTCYYAVFTTSPNGYSIHPLGYAIKVFCIAGNGQILPIVLDSNKDKINVRIYSTISDKNVYITVINKEFGYDGRKANIIFNLNADIETGNVISLTSPSGDFAAVSGIELGDSGISDDAEWNGKWVPLNLSAMNGRITINISAATAVIIKLTIR